MVSNWKNDVSSDLNYDETHRQRWELTLQYCSDLLIKEMPKLNVLALGSDGQFEQSLKSLNPNLDISLSTWDLRYPFPRSEKLYDVVLMLEVIEHLKDRQDETEDVATHYFTGLLSCLLNVKRALKPGGHLIITTPNASSYASIKKTITGESSYLYWPHVRELAPFELSFFLQQCGFENKVLSSFSPYLNDPKPRPLKKKILDLITGYLGGESGKLKTLRESTMLSISCSNLEPKEILLETEWKKVKRSELE